MNYRPDIDGLRALAVLPVVLFHAGVPLFSGGYVGVDVFFVISGFLITGIIKTEIDAGRFSIIRFYERRARRILPAFFAVVAVTAAIGWFIMLPDDYGNLAASIVAATLFLSNIFFWAQSGSYFDAPAETKPMLHTWSLAVEEQFYLFFPVVLMLAVWALARLKRSQGLLIWLIVAASLVSFALSAWGAYYKPVATFYWLPTRAWELMLGSLLALGVLGPVRGRLAAEGLSYFGIGLILFSSIFYSATTVFPGAAALLPTFGAALIIYAVGGRETSAGQLLAIWPLRFIGLISYSFYLWHWPVIVFVKYYYGAAAGAYHLAAAVLLSLLLAILSWRYVEAPFRTNRQFFTRRRLFALSGGAMAVTTAAAAFVYLGDGLPQRLPQEVRNVLENSQYRDARFEECHNATERQARLTDLCIRGASAAKPSFVLVGDSHAAATAAGLFEAAEEKELAGYQLTDPGWRPTLSYRMLAHEKQYAGMDRRLRAVLADEAIDLVIIVVYWEAAIDETYVRGSELVEGEDAVPDALVQLAADYPDKEFILFRDIPVSDNFGAEALAKAMMFGGSRDQKISAQAYREEWREVAAILSPLRRAENVKWIGIEDVLCDRRFCYGRRNGAMVYHDPDHLTTRFAEKNAGIFERAFE
ncbi:acyltransferase 3 [Parvibaculum lavamentivorans DS-1]|uniref:Acyltransferase 3 n=1 Tax=Parvibaculum lavamentivorans (strain DS-1 / DSM 13023 / NCIMB 13966) TaxID=402881 RepID=A7HUH9_PARL1|nr:acyltransferase family protein [Parvibaculum lavamentivorans]ABS63562.1 acyltransferase 3 [Parvibaculum lavamentivorans DS-1]